MGRDEGGTDGTVLARIPPRYAPSMELKIGVIHSKRELELEVGDDEDAVRAEIDKVESALSNGVRVIWFTDTKGRHVGVVADKLAYLEFESGTGPKVVGFAT